MKKIIISLLAITCLVACQTPLEKYKKLTDATIEQMNTAPSRDVVDSLIDSYVAQSYDLLIKNIKKDSKSSENDILLCSKNVITVDPPN